MLNFTLRKYLLSTINKHGFESLQKSYSTNGHRIGLFGAPISKGQPKPGTDMGPELIRQAGIVKYLEAFGNEVYDFGDLQFQDLDQSKDKIGLLKNPYTVAAATKLLSEKVSQIVNKGLVPLTIGGDHSIAIGSVNGHAKAKEDICLIWIDAHADLNTVESSKTGNFHGMPVSFLIREFAEKFGNPNGKCPAFDWNTTCLNADSVAFIGLRDLDIAERNHLNQLNIVHYTMQDVDKLGIYEVISRVLDKICSGKKNIHVSFDIDAVDENIVKSTGTAVPGGLTLREAFCIGEEIAKTKLLTGFDLVEVNPLIGTQNDVKQTINCALNIVLSFFGRNRIDLFARPKGQEHYKID